MKAKIAYSVSEKQARLSNTTVADKQELEQVVTMNWLANQVQSQKTKSTYYSQLLAIMFILKFDYISNSYNLSKYKEY